MDPPSIPVSRHRPDSAVRQGAVFLSAESGQARMARLLRGDCLGAKGRNWPTMTTERLKQDMAYWSGLGPDEWFHHCSICDEPCWHFEETIRQDCQCERECPEG